MSREATLPPCPKGWLYGQRLVLAPVALESPIWLPWVPIPWCNFLPTKPKGVDLSQRSGPWGARCPTADQYREEYGGQGCAHSVSRDPGYFRRCAPETLLHALQRREGIKLLAMGSASVTKRHFRTAPLAASLRSRESCRRLSRSFPFSFRTLLTSTKSNYNF